MNKIILIGNGFDLAHKLPTKYEDFLKYLIATVIEIIDFPKNHIQIHGRKCENNDYYHRMIDQNTEDPWICVKFENNNIVLDSNSCNKEKSIYFKSLFKTFKNTGLWSDLEEHYYKKLKENKNQINNVITINKEFEHLKKILFNYLKFEVEDKINSFEYPCPHETFIKLFNHKHNNYSFVKEHFVTFNYTSNLLNQYVSYLKKMKNKETIPLNPIHIHGDLNSSDNPIIFGYGDDNSNDYKELQDSKEKDLLQYFKTFQYLRSNRYRQILGLLEETDEIYIQIIGHSFESTDKALLKTIFQHQNVKHIEATFYDSENVYFENLYKISRIFDDNTKMRQKLVPLEETFKIDKI